ncbi:uncharacterized protein LOC141714043 [Apium graveolens]|uniref:uncharacterized protein LOC141714043 n=1 Tax=Apium graveolens TaxID=4045 RepID=UPI003D792F8E
MEYYGLDELSEERNQMSIIKVKVSRKWEEKHPATRDLIGLNLILIDQYYKRIHCWVDRTLMKQYADLLCEGKIYSIDKFSVKAYTGTNRCFEMDHHIILLKSSLISKFDDHYTIVPPDICMFVNLKNIHELGNADSALIDVVGMVCSVKQEKNITTHSLEGRTYVDFKITHFINKVKVRFWDDVGQEFYNSFSQATVLPAAIIIASAKLRRNNYTMP